MYAKKVIDWDEVGQHMPDRVGLGHYPALKDVLQINLALPNRSLFVAPTSDTFPARGIGTPVLEIGLLRRSGQIIGVALNWATPCLFVLEY